MCGCHLTTHCCAGNRVHADQISGDLLEAANQLPDDSVDAFISTYVLDILSDNDIDAVLSLAGRYLPADERHMLNVLHACILYLLSCCKFYCH